MATISSPSVLEQRSSDDGRSWHVVRTLPRQERVLGRALEQCGLTFYLPVTEQRLQYQGRLAVTLVPVYPGHLFLFGDQLECRRCIATGLALEVLKTSDPAGLKRVVRGIARAIEGKLVGLPRAATFLKMTSHFANTRSANPVDSQSNARV